MNQYICLETNVMFGLHSALRDLRQARLLSYFYRRCTLNSTSKLTFNTESLGSGAYRSLSNVFGVDFHAMRDVSLGGCCVIPLPGGHVGPRLFRRDRTPVDEIYGCPGFEWAAVTLIKDRVPGRQPRCGRHDSMPPSASMLGLSYTHLWYACTQQWNPSITDAHTAVRSCKSLLYTHPTLTHHGPVTPGHRTWPTLVWVRACRQTEPSHHLEKSWLLMKSCGIHLRAL